MWSAGCDGSSTVYSCIFFAGRGLRWVVIVCCIIVFLRFSFPSWWRDENSIWEVSLVCGEDSFSIDSDWIGGSLADGGGRRSGLLRRVSRSVSVTKDCVGAEMDHILRYHLKVRVVRIKCMIYRWVDVYRTILYVRWGVLITGNEKRLWVARGTYNIICIRVWYD